jgi:hypothetical protein
MEQVGKPQPVTDSLSRRRLIVLFLTVPLAVAAIWIGGTDLLSTADLTSRLFGAALTLIGVALLFGYVALVLGASWAKELTLLACASGMLAGIVLFVIQLAAYNNQRLLIWLGVVVVFAVCVYELLHSGARTTPLAKLGAILSAGTVIGLAQLFYSGPYVLSAHPAKVSIASELGRTGSINVGARRTPTLALHGRVVVKNHSSSGVQVVGSVYVLVGVKTKPDSRMVNDVDWATRVRESFEQNSEAFRVIGNKELTVLGSGVLYSLGYTISPEAEDVFETTLYAPSRGFDSIYFVATISTARADRLSLSDEPITTNAVDDEKSPSEIWDEWGVRETSLVNKLTRESRYLHTGWTLKSDSSDLLPSLSVYVDAEARRNKSYSDYNRRLERVYGINSSSAVSEIAL